MRSMLSNSYDVQKQLQASVIIRMLKSFQPSLPWSGLKRGDTAQVPAAFGPL